LLTLFFAWWFVVLFFVLGDWYGHEQFHDAYTQGLWMQIALLASALIVQVIGGIASGVALGLNDGTIRGCIRRTKTLTVGFSFVTAAVPIVVVAVASPRSIPYFGWAFIVAIICGIVIAALLRFGLARISPVQHLRLI